MVKYLTDGADEGHSMGQTTADPISFYGYTPVAQQAATAQSAVATTALTTITDIVTTASLTGAFNSVVARCAALTVLVNQIRTDLVAYGLQKGEA
jgi:hypothetical protein